MKKLLFVIFILQSICSFGQPQGFQENRSGLGVANKNMLSDTEAYFFTNGRTSKRTSRAFNAAKSITKKDNIAPILEKSFNIEVPQEGNYYFLANVLSTYLSDGTFTSPIESCSILKFSIRHKSPRKKSFGGIQINLPPLPVLFYTVLELKLFYYVF